MAIMHVPGGKAPHQHKSDVSDGPRYFGLKWSGQIPADPVTMAAARPKEYEAPAPIIWTAPLLQRSGYGEEARCFLLALDRAGVSVLANPTDWHLETP